MIPETEMPVAPPEEDRHRFERMEQIGNSLAVAYHGLRAAVAQRLMERSGSTMERMEHKDALYADLGNAALADQLAPGENRYDENAIRRGQLPPSPTASGEPARPRTIVESRMDRHIEGKSWNQAMRRAERKWTVSTYMGERTRKDHPLTKRETRRRNARVEQAQRRGELTAAERRRARMRIAANPMAYENHGQHKTRHKLHKADRDVRRAANQPFLSRWRQLRRGAAVAGIKSHHRSAEKHRQAAAGLRGEEYGVLPLDLGDDPDDYTPPTYPRTPGPAPAGPDRIPPGLFDFDDDDDPEDFIFPPSRPISPAPTPITPATTTIESDYSGRSHLRVVRDDERSSAAPAPDKPESAPETHDPYAGIFEPTLIAGLEKLIDGKVIEGIHAEQKRQGVPKITGTEIGDIAEKVSRQELANYLYNNLGIDKVPADVERKISRLLVEARTRRTAAEEADKKAKEQPKVVTPKPPVRTAKKPQPSIPATKKPETLREKKARELAEKRATEAKYGSYRDEIPD